MRSLLTQRARDMLKKVRVSLDPVEVADLCHKLHIQEKIDVKAMIASKVFKFSACDKKLTEFCERIKEYGLSNLLPARG